MSDGIATFFEPGGLRVKICGLTSEADARMCREAGADALGFNFFPGSKRYIDPELALPWIRDLGAGAARIAVVVNPDDGLIGRLRDSGAIDAIQFHGDETPEFCESAGFLRWIKALRIRDRDSMQASNEFRTPHVLFDAYVEGSYGGTGARLEWDKVRDFIAVVPDRQFILAGGLTPENVGEAARTVRPHAVDVAGGVESSVGKKDEKLVRAFIEAVR